MLMFAHHQNILLMATFMFQGASGVRTVLKTVHAKMEVAVNLIPENVFVLQDGKAFIAHINVVTNFSA